MKGEGPVETAKAERRLYQQELENETNINTVLFSQVYVSVDKRLYS